MHMIYIINYSHMYKYFLWSVLTTLPSAGSSTVVQQNATFRGALQHNYDLVFDIFVNF